MIGDAPTGAWSGHPRSFAEWDGARWAYQPIADARLHSDRKGLLAAPGLIAEGEAVLLAERGFIRCCYRNNDLTAGGAIRDRSGEPGIAVGGKDMLYWDARFEGNLDEVRIRRGRGISAFRAE